LPLPIPAPSAKKGIGGSSPTGELSAGWPTDPPAPTPDRREMNEMRRPRFLVFDVALDESVPPGEVDIEAEANVDVLEAEVKVEVPFGVYAPPLPVDVEVLSIDPSLSPPNPSPPTNGTKLLRFPISFLFLLSSFVSSNTPALIPFPTPDMSANAVAASKSPSTLLVRLQRDMLGGARPPPRARVPGE